MSSQILASRVFTVEDQQQFAELSGDFNPMHLDAVAARRTPAGERVVHGMHGLLWSLEQLAHITDLRRICAINADFSQFIYVNEPVTLTILKQTDQQLMFELRVEGTRVAATSLRLGARAAHSGNLVEQISGAALAFDDFAIDLPFDDLARAHGRIEYFTTGNRISSAFPALDDGIGTDRITSLMSLTRLVGMAVPGVHSVFHRVNVNFVEQDSSPGALHFAVSSAEERFKILNIRLVADGLAGSVKASMRTPPVTQPSMTELKALVAADEFQGHTAFIVGGSRGLGELTAKLIASGGGRVIISYSVGKLDADKIVADIKLHGGQAETLHFDARVSPSIQLDQLPALIDSVYYFATERISSRPLAQFSFGLFKSFADIYIDSFNELIQALRRRSDNPISAFYPSTIAILDRPANMTEYAMAKAAGEVLCADLARFTHGLAIEIVRLPRLSTDQTASIMPMETHDAISVMLPIIRRVHSAFEPNQNSSTILSNAG
ncbi:MAG: hypothetical protein B7Z78_06165 [Rhodospirillales bacterium 20-60-12]|nr:MAG: hypothetical protein B7Z78_06165 [Rhodospirillales bacterium 20-60-12]